MDEFFFGAPVPPPLSIITSCLSGPFCQAKDTVRPPYPSAGASVSFSRVFTSTGELECPVNGTLVGHFQELKPLFLRKRASRIDLPLR